MVYISIMAVYRILCILVLYLSSIVGQEIALTYHLRENQEVGTFVGNTARDSLLYRNISESEFQRLKFTFLTQGNPNTKYFNIDEKSSTIRTASVIDREAICSLQISCILMLDIAVYMRDPVINDYDLYKLMKVKLMIDDVNDNSPYFPKSRVSLSVPESVPVGHVLLTSGAVDEDMGQNNSIQSYDLISGSGIFGLKIVKNWDGSSDLGIVIKHQLDRETLDKFQIEVVAKDGGYPMKTGTVIIDITVTDMNDNRPVFSKTMYNITVNENIPYDVTVLDVSADDADDGINGDVSYRFSSRISDKVKKTFNIDPLTGRIYSIGEIDYEDTKQYQFMVEALDGGSPSLSSNVLINITVKDENDNAPEININLTPEGTDISEAADTKKFVAHVSVSDKDSGRNSFVECAMSDNYFTLESFFGDSYKIILGKKLDHETQASHNVTITCQDNGHVPLTNSSSFIVHVLDENDNFPEFSQTRYSGSIIENNEIGEEILQVSAHDWDSGNNGRVRYSIDSDTARYFSIDRNSGIISALVELDRESNPEFRFNVVASDFGNQPKAQSVDVVITVLDQNDQPPRLTNPVFLCYVLENLNPGAAACNISAIDKDTAANSEFLFSIPINSWALDYFSVHPRTGLVTTKKIFDRESNDKYSFTVNVRDPQVSGFADSANITVYILDDNDHVPIIVYPTADNYTAEVPYNATVGMILATVQAYDDDEPANSQILYMLKSGNNRHLFNVNRLTGDLILSRRIRPDDSGLYKLEIMVSDSGNPPMASRTKLFVNVAETNGTVFGVNGEGEMDKNVLIVISLVIVTLILGIAIVTTICLIKRIDKERQQQIMLMKTEEEKMFSGIKKQESFSSVSNENEEFIKKNIRKEVSFSLDDEADTTLSGVTSFTTFKSQGNPHSNQSDLQDNCLVIGNNTLNTTLHSNIPVNNDVPQPSPPVHQQWTDDNEEEARQLMEILKKADDEANESSGETATSDSGRGGSDEETHRDEGIDHDDTKVFHGNSFYPNSYHKANFNHFNEGRQSSLSLTSGYGSLSRPVVLGSSHGDTNTVSGSSFRRWKDVHPCPNEGPDDVFKDSYLRLPKYAVFKQNRSGYNQIYKDHLRSIELLEDKPFQNGFSGVYDEDCINTTSDSYTVNPDELQTDIDGLFLKDTVV